MLSAQLHNGADYHYSVMTVISASTVLKRGSQDAEKGVPVRWQ